MSVASVPHIIRRGASVMSIAYKYYRPKLSAGNPRRGKKGTRFPYDLTPGFRPTGRGNFTGSRTDCKPCANNGLFWVKRGFRGVRVPAGTRTGEGADEQERKRDFRSASARSRAAKADGVDRRG